MDRKSNRSSNSAWKPLAGLLATLALASTSAQAAIISVSGPQSSEGVNAEIIDAPSGVMDGDTINFAQQGFNEAQGVTTSIAYGVDGGGVIDVGTTVDSHMIFLNMDGDGMVSHNDVLWTFSGTILGVMSDGAGAYEVSSTPELGAAGTDYPSVGFDARGFEDSDSYSLISPNVLSVSLSVGQPGDWIRVVTTSSVPEPASAGLLALGLGLLGLRRRSSRNNG